MNIPNEFANRHPNTLHILQYFAFDHLPEPLRYVSECNYKLALTMLRQIPDGLELEAGLRKLLEAKDCFVRASLPFVKPQEIRVNNQEMSPEDYRQFIERFEAEKINKKESGLGNI